MEEVTGITPTEGMAASLLPIYIEGGKKARYLSYLVSGFSIMEASKLAKVHYKSVLRWRQDPQFLDTEQQCVGELRKKLSNELLDLEFTRNFRLVMAKDFEILFKDAQGLP